MADAIVLTKQGMITSYIVYGVRVDFIGFSDVSENEPKNYVNFVRKHADIPAGYRLSRIDVKACSDGKVDLDYELQGPRFERIRRITGYLTGSTDSWNDAKRAEERDRVKHDF